MSESKLFTRNIRNKNKNIKLSDLGVNYLLPNVPIKHTASNSKILDIDQITTERSLEQSATPILSTRKQDDLNQYGLSTVRSSDTISKVQLNINSLGISRKKHSLYSLESYMTPGQTPRKPQASFPKPPGEKELEQLEMIQIYMRKLEKNIPRDNEPTKQRLYASHKILKLICNEEGKYQRQMKTICQEIENGLFCLNPYIKERASRFVPSILHNSVLEPYPHFMLAEKLIEYIENTEIQNKMRDEAHLKEIDDLKKKLDTINNHYERENKHLQKLLDKDNDRHDAVIQNMNQLIEKHVIEKNTINEEFDKIKQNLTENLEDPTHAEYIKHIQEVTMNNMEMREIIRQQAEELENLRNNFHFFINGYKKMAIKLKYVSEKTQKIKEDIRQPHSFLVDDSSFS